MISLLLLISSIYMIIRKVKGAVFLLIFWCINTTLIFLEWADNLIDGINFEHISENLYLSFSASIIMSVTLFLWLFNVQRIRKVKEIGKEDTQ